MEKMSKKDILSLISFDYVLQLNAYSKILKGRYFTKKDFVNGLSKNLSLRECHILLDCYFKNENPKQAMIKLLFEKTNDKIIREHFVNWLLRNKIKSITNDVVFFEFPIEKNRTDINRINGKSITYEIKSGRDDLRRAISQTEAFLRAFEYVFIIVDGEIKQKEIELFNNKVGFYSWNRKKDDFQLIREAKYNKGLRAESQINSLRKDELKRYKSFSTDNREKIVKSFNQEVINKAFKEVLKERYKSNWVSYCGNISQNNLVLAQ